MVKVKIDNKEMIVDEGKTILEAASSAGIAIPTLCHKDGLTHYTSCMVCLVKDKRTGNFIPSCTALCQDDMDIDASDTDVIELRRKSVELLLSEHRAECEAPCRTVCPAGYNIPLMNRLLSAKDEKNGKLLYSEQLSTSFLWCWNCPGYCENACRRKKIDIPVSIRNLQIFISGETKPPDGESVPKPERKKRRFSSFTGPLEAAELQEWLKECTTGYNRFREFDSIDLVSQEAQSCMHCDCRAADNCRLRDIAGDLNLKDPKGKIVNSPAAKKINHSTNLIFENAKCIKCGLCVRVCEDKTDDPALCFVNRGFISIISEPLTGSFDDTLKSEARKCIDVCPTGALSWFKSDPADEMAR